MNASKNQHLCGLRTRRTASVTKDDITTQQKNKSKPKQANRVPWAPNFPANAMNVIDLHRPPVEWHRTSSEFASTQKHHAPIFKWIYVRNKQTSTKPRPGQNTMSLFRIHVRPFFHLNYCIEVTMLFVVRVCCTLQLPHPCCILNQKFITIRPLSRCTAQCTSQTGKCIQWQHWARWKSHTPHSQ